VKIVFRRVKIIAIVSWWLCISLLLMRLHLAFHNGAKMKFELHCSQIAAINFIAI